MSILLLAAAGTLAALDPSDPVAHAAAARSTPETTHVRGTLQPFVAPPTGAWTLVATHLDNQTYVLDGGRGDPVILVTGMPVPGPGHVAAPNPHTPTDVIGTITLRTLHPDGSGRTLIVLRPLPAPTAAPGR